MKKILTLFLIFLFAVTLSVAIILFFYEDRIVDTFKEQIIDKTNINLNYSKIHLSFFKSFPLCSFVLDDVSIRYTSDKNSDTLLVSKKLRFKINVINVFRSIYEFPEIIVSDGRINFIKEKVDLLFSKDLVPDKKPCFYLVKTEKVKINNCVFKYSANNKVHFNVHLRNVSCFGSFIPNSLALRLNFYAESLTGNFNTYKIKSKDGFFVSLAIKEKNDNLFSENGLIKFNSIKIGFSFDYSFKNDSFRATLSSSEGISIKELNQPIFDKLHRLVSTGNFSFSSYYTANINNLDSQKLSVSYEFKNVTFFSNTNISISKLKGTTTLLGNFEKNVSEIQNFSLNYSGLSFEGSAKIKDFPHPYILVDTKVKKKSPLKFNKTLTVNGEISGGLKLLAKLDDIYSLNDSTFKIYKINSLLKVSNLSIENNDKVKEITGDIQFDENRLSFKGNGTLLNSPFNGEIEIPDFLNVAIHNQIPAPRVSLRVNRLNLDSILVENTKDTGTKLPTNFHLTSNVNRLIYKGCEINNLGLGLNCSNGNYTCNRFSMNIFSGNITGSFTSTLSKAANYSVVFQNIDIHNLFKTFNNFEQNTITSENINGNLSGKADISFKYDNIGKINPLSLKVSSELLIERGELHDLSQFERLSNFLNLKEVESIKFKTLVNNIDIENGVVSIPSMNISSSAINFQLSGQHNFNGDFTYWLKVNLKEILAKKFLLKNKYNSDYEDDNENGLNLFFKFYGNNENYKLSLDKKSSFSKLKNNFKPEGPSIKQIINEEFNLSKKGGKSSFDSISSKPLNKVDTNHNKNKKIPFKIEWDEIDTTKTF